MGGVKVGTKWNMGKGPVRGGPHVAHRLRAAEKMKQLLSAICESVLTNRHALYHYDVL